jgi:hypothetical protein
LGCIRGCGADCDSRRGALYLHEIDGLGLVPVSELHVWKRSLHSATVFYTPGQPDRRGLLACLSFLNDLDHIDMSNHPSKTTDG